MNDLLHWWNAIYWVPLLLSVVWILLTALTGHTGTHDAGHVHMHGNGHVGHGDAHVSHGAGHAAAHGHAGHATSHAHGHGHSHSHTHDTAEPQQSDWVRVVDVLGLGRVPITLFLGLVMLFWGTFGLLANNVLRDLGRPPALNVGDSLAATVFFTLIATRIAVGVVGRFMPTTETFAITNYDLIGREGVAVYSVTADIGTVQVADPYGTIHRCMAKTEPGVVSIAANTRILVVGVDDAQDSVRANERLIVREYDSPQRVAERG